MNWYITVLKKYAQFSGRARRKEFWMFALVNTVITYALLFLGLAMRLPYLNIIYSLGVLLPSLAVGVRRMHDINKSGWFFIIPFVNIILACMPGTVGENAYGEDPKDYTLFGAQDYEKPFDVNA